MSHYITACADWDGQTIIRARLYRDDVEIAAAAQVVADCDDTAVQALGEALADQYGLELSSSWSVAPDPTNGSGDRRMVWIAAAAPAPGPIPCQRPTADPDHWYPAYDPEGLTPAAVERHLEAYAAAICDGCPIIDQCRAAGMTERWGIWGGQAPHQRRARRRAAETLALAVSA